ncbi:MAG: efflux RND transporter periplasmic adaptor subunit [Calditrichaeota bacterium]|nr:MAG: efflux RND transporter periplasmic adaptor subunit [Calditrichota bacterium]
MKRASWIKAVVIVTVVVGLGVLYHQYFRSEEEESARPTFSEEEVNVRPVKVKAAPAFIGELVQYITASGVTEALQEAEIKPLLNGRVKAVHVRDGQRVNRGAVLVELDDREYRIALEEARSNLLKAQVEYGLLKEEARKNPAEPAVSTNHLEALEEEYTRARQAYEAGELSEEAFRKIEREYHTAQVFSGEMRDELLAQQSGLSAAEAAFARARYNLDNCRLVAPFSGVVGDVTVHVGDLIGPSQTVMRLVDLSKLKLKLQVLEAELGQVQVGEAIRASFAAFPDTTFPGRITGVSPVVDSQTRTGTVIAEINNPGGLLKSGMFATVRIAVNRYPDRLLVPRAAIVERDQRKLIFIVREGKAVWSYVETGLENDEYVEIVSSRFNLQPGEPVIVDGHFALAHNAPVEIE